MLASNHAVPLLATRGNPGGIMVRSLAVALLGLVLAAPASAAGVPKEKVTCTDTSRDCLIAVARTYILARLDSTLRMQMRLAPNVHRWENNVLTATVAEDLTVRGADDGTTDGLAGRDLDRVFVDGKNVIFLWTIDVTANTYPGTVHLTHRIAVEAGQDKCGSALSPCITEIETVWCSSKKNDEVSLPRQKSANFRGTFGCHREG